MSGPKGLLKAELELAISRAGAQLSAPGRHSYASRLAAIDALEVQVFDRIGPVKQPDLVIRSLKARAQQLAKELRAGNRAILQALMARIRRGRLRGPALLRELLLQAGKAGEAGAFDDLDCLVAELLQFADAPKEQKRLESGMTAYQPCPARVIVGMLKKAALGPKDVFYDLGSGLGRVTLMAAMLTRAKAKGVEYEPAFCRYARRSAKRLGLKDVSFVCADARKASLDDGTFFFLYTPFVGDILAQALDRLRLIAQHKAIKVCAFGPCVREVARAPWLKAKGPLPPEPGVVVIFEPVLAARS